MKFVPLGEVATIDRATVNPNEIPGDTQYVGLEHITKFSREVHPVTAETARLSSTKHRFDQHQILYGKLRPYLAKIATPDFDGVCSTDILPLTPCESVDRSYLYYFLSQPSKVREVSKQATGANLPRVQPAALENLKIPLPPLDEQRRIAAILDKADAIRQKRRQIFEHLEDLSQSLFLHFFKDHAETCAFSSLVDEFRYGTSNRSVDTGYPALRIPNVVQSRLNLADIKYVPVSERELEKLKLQNGDLLFVRTNGTLENVGRCSIFNKNKVETSSNIDSPWIYASYLIRARLKDGTSPEFIHGFFNSTKGRASIRKSSRTSAGQYNINIHGISNVQIPSVPKNKQIEFAALSARIDALSNEAAKQISIADEVFAALQSRAFRGEL